MTYLLYCSLCLCFLFIVFQLFNELWWTPRRIQKLLASQGVKGPSYKFFHGNTKEIKSMTHKAMATPMELSDHHCFPRAEPHIYTWIKLYGANFLTWIGSRAQLVVTDPNLVKVILNNKDGAFPKKKLENHHKKLVGDGIFTSEGEKWHRKRKLSNHAFHGENLRAMTPTMVETSEMLIKRWRNQIGKEIEAFQEFKLFSSEVISRTAFGSNYLEGERIFDMLTRLATIVSKTTFQVRIPGIGKFVKTSEDVESDRLDRGIRDSIIELIKKREELVKTGKSETYQSDFLGVLVSAHHSDDKSKKFTVDEMIDECKTLYLAGHLTGQNLLGWAVFLLAVHPEWQDKAREEVLKLFGQEKPTPQGISSLTTMGMIINETLRLYPPVPNIRRTAEREVVLGDMIVPADMDVYIYILALHHNPKIWGEDAHLFNPERFAEGVAKATNNNSTAFIPFGWGSRMCVGLNFATNEAKIVLSMILQNYRLTMSPNYVHSPAMTIGVRPQHGMRIVLQSL